MPLYGSTSSGWGFPFHDRIRRRGGAIPVYRFAEDFVFTKAFRKRFQVPEEAASIADRILQKRHHDWIEAYLLNTSRWWHDDEHH